MMLIFSAKLRCPEAPTDPDLGDSTVRVDGTPEKDPIGRNRSRNDRLPIGVCSVSLMDDGIP
jgi:hypothetical protein